ncbi:MAG: sugar transferase, partial [Dehalococcoidia bacterium]|nr:sugar transferase [Dehalococcoidia bacterium]
RQRACAGHRRAAVRSRPPRPHQRAIPLLRSGSRLSMESEGHTSSNTSSIRVPANAIAVHDWWKRPFDLVVLLAVHISLAPIWLALWTFIPLTIWLSDRGPVFYTQARVGKGGRIFRAYKFRSMVPDAERYTGAVWAEEDDPRITRVGRFLRSRALDELPQVINMWKGDISLVGPRPERPELVEEFTQQWPEFGNRLAVRPGLTGIAQVYGRYSTHPRDKVRYDMIYVRRMSPWLDIKLLALSVLITVRARWQGEER